jgi:drug/metabolite transporter (DMT)-like permease
VDRIWGSFVPEPCRRPGSGAIDEHTGVRTGVRAPDAESVDAPRPLERGRPAAGYAIIVAGTLLGAVNATVGKVAIVSGGVSAVRLAQFRAAAAAVLLLAALVLVRRRQLLPSRRQLPFLALFGLFGLALAQASYFLSIEHLDVGVALVIVNVAIVLVALWGRFVAEERVDARLWIAIVLALAGLALVVGVWRGAALDALGVAAGLVGAVTYSLYILMADRNARAGGHASVLVAWGFVFATVFWAIAQPWWRFPFGLLDDDVSFLGRLAAHTAPVWLLLICVAFGTVGVYVLYAAALRYIPPTHVVLVAVLEPVFGAFVAFAWLGETLAPLQLAGGVLVLAAVVLSQSTRERAPGGPAQAAARARTARRRPPGRPRSP